MYMFRKFWTIAIPVIICLVLFRAFDYVDFDMPTKPLPFMLLLALIFQNIVFRYIYSDEMDEFSENLADKMIPQTLNGMFGPLLTTIISVFGTYIVSFMILLIFSIRWTPSNLSSWIVLTLCLGMLLSPIVNNLLNATNLSDLVNIEAVGAIYFITCMLGVASLSRLTELLEAIPYMGSSENITILILAWTFLLARSHHIIELSFRQKEGMWLFNVSLIPLVISAFDELVFVSGFL